MPGMFSAIDRDEVCGKFYVEGSVEEVRGRLAHCAGPTSWHTRSPRAWTRGAYLALVVSLGAYFLLTHAGLTSTDMAWRAAVGLGAAYIAARLLHAYLLRKGPTTFAPRKLETARQVLDALRTECAPGAPCWLEIVGDPLAQVERDEESAEGGELRRLEWLDIGIALRHGVELSLMATFVERRPLADGDRRYEPEREEICVDLSPADESQQWRIVATPPPVGHPIGGLEGLTISDLALFQGEGSSICLIAKSIHPIGQEHMLAVVALARGMVEASPSR